MLDKFASEKDFFKQNIKDKMLNIFERKIVFVFGGPYQAVSSFEAESSKFGSLLKKVTDKLCSPQAQKIFRKEFYELSSSFPNLDEFKYLYAEELFDFLSPLKARYDYSNIALIEKFSGFIVDAIIIFPESVGSFCEIGYFAHSNVLRKKTIVANNEAFSESRSFLKLGIVDIIEKYSNYRGIVHLSPTKCNNSNYVKILNRIKVNLDQPRVPKAKILDLNHYNRENKSTDTDVYYRMRFQLFYEIVNFFKYISFRDAETVFREVIGHTDDDELEVYAAVLLSLNWIKNSSGSPEMLAVPAFFSSLENKLARNSMQNKHFEILGKHRKLKTLPFRVFEEELSS